MQRFCITSLILLYLCLYLANSSTPYRLYEQPSNMNPQVLFDKFKVIIPEGCDLFVVLEQKQQQQSSSNLVLFVYEYRKGAFNEEQIYIKHFPNLALGLINVFWVFDDSVLFVTHSAIILYQTPIYGRKENRTDIKSNKTILLADIIYENERDYLIIVQNATNNWIIMKYQLVDDGSEFLNLTLSQSLKKPNKQTLNKIIITKNYICLLLKTINDRQKMYCLNIKTQLFSNFSIQKKVIIKSGNSQTDDIYGIYDSSQIIKFSLSQNGSRINDSRLQLFSDGEYDIDLRICENEIFIIFTVQFIENRFYFIILQQIELEYVPTQYILFQTQLDTITDLVVVKNRQQLNIVSIRQSLGRFSLAYTSYINQQIENYLWIVLLTLLSFAFLFNAFNFVMYFSMIKHVFLIERRHINLTLEILLVSIVHGIVYILVLFTDTSSNANFIQSPQRSVSLQSFQVRMYQTLFLFTTIISVVIQSSLEYRAKSSYLNFLTKHGLNPTHYYHYRQVILVTKSIFYSSVSIWVFSYLQQICKPSLRVNPSFQQLLLVSITYALCHFIMQNMAHALVYVCRRYWLLMQITLAFSFVVLFVTGQFYLNKSFSLQEKIVTSVNPITLFYSFTQQVFKTEIRFNNKDVSTTFLMIALAFQSFVSAIIFRLVFVHHHKATSFKALIKVKKEKIGEVINKSVERQSFETDQRNENLLNAYIPYKLSTNGGLEKVCVLKDVRFSGRRGQVITFLDTENLSKRTLFQILVNDQKSDSNIQRDAKGEVRYTQNVIISIIFDEIPQFHELNILQRLELISTLRNPTLSKTQKQKDIQFILNEFNIPVEFRKMKSSHLSGGYQKKASLACAFIGDPDVVIIDEPTLGLDIRFKNILHRKLRVWKEHKLIILGTSDQTEAEAVSDRVYVLQKGRAVNRTNLSSKRLITRINISFGDFDCHQEALQITDSFFKTQSIFRQNQFNQIRKRYRIRLEIFKDDQESRRQMQQLMKELNERFNFRENNIFLSFSIHEHPFDELSLTPFRASPNRQLSELTYKDIEMYHVNRVFDEGHDDQELYDLSEQSNNDSKSKARKLIRQLKNSLQTTQYLWLSQMKGILYIRSSLWQGNKMKYEFFMASLYLWVQQFLWYKMNRPLAPYDQVNALVLYCLLHVSLFNSHKLGSQSALMIGVNHRLIALVNWLYDWGYTFAGYSLNCIARAILIDEIILGKSEFSLGQKIICGLFFTVCYTLFTSLLIKMIKNGSTVIALLLLTNYCLVQVRFNSFFIAYKTKISNIVELFFYPLTTIGMFDALCIEEEVWLFMVSFICQVGVFLFVLTLLHTSHYSRKSKNIIKDYCNIHSQAVNDERVLIENVTDKAALPLICDNLIHVYQKDAILRNLYLHVNAGELYGLLGHNGCGKTTLLKILAGQIRQSKGEALIFGENAGKLNVGYCPQSGLLFEEATVEQNIRLAGALRGLKAKSVSLFMIKLFRYFRLKGIEQVKTKYLSDAQKKKVSLVVAILSLPRLMLFDQVTSGVDYEGRKKILELMRSYCEECGAAALLATHDIAEIQDFCDRVSVLKEGVIRRAGKPSQLRTQQQHQFYVLTLWFLPEAGEALLERRKAKIKQFIGSLTFVRVEREERLILAYSLDIKKLDILGVWEKAYNDFYLGQIVEKFQLRRHGLLEVVKFSLMQEEENQEWQPISKVYANDMLRERLI